MLQVGTAILELLRHPDLLVPSSKFFDVSSYIRSTRLAGLVFLYELYKTDPISSNPFNNVFGRYVCTNIQFSVIFQLESISN